MPVPARIAVFALASAGLIAFALALAPAGSAPPAPSSPAPPATVAVPDSELIAVAERRKARLDRAARTFISAFLRYEVGDLPVAVARSLDHLTTAEFRHYLLASPPRRPSRGHSRAQIVEVETAFLSPAAARALVRGVARRPDGPEELSFVFVLRGGRWLAAGAAE